MIYDSEILTPLFISVCKKQFKLQIDGIEHSIRAFVVNIKCNIYLNMQTQSEILQKQWESL